MKFLNFINELFDKPAKYEITDNSGNIFIASFNIESQQSQVKKTKGRKKKVTEPQAESKHYEVKINRMQLSKPVGGGSKALWYITFGLFDKSGMEYEDITNTGDAVKVFATVVDIIKEFIKQKNPINFKFGAKETSRQKLYDRFAKLIETKMGFTYKTFQESDTKMYLFTKKA